MRDEDKDGGRRLQLEKTEDDPKCAGGGPEAEISKG